MSELTPPDRANAVAVIVTLAPDEGLTDRLASLTSQVAHVLIVDNGSGIDDLTIIQRSAKALDATVILNDANMGVGRALNQAMVWAIDIGAEWVLLLDQDTRPLPGLIDEARHVYAATPWPARVAVIAGRQPGARSRSGTPTWMEVPAVITAGSVVSTRAYAMAGRFRDEYFIDYVDIEFCLRARRAGYRVVVGASQTIDHQIGAPTTHRLGWRAVTPSNHSASRRYRITRNRILVWRAYWRNEPGFVARDVLAATKEAVKIVLFEDRRAAKVRAIIRGIVDGVRGRTDTLPLLPRQ